MRAEQVTEPWAEHGEGPVWWSGWGGLKYVDMLRGDVLSLADDASVTRAHVGTVAAALRPRAGGGAVIATERSFALASRNDLSDARPIGDVWSDPAIRFNDGACDPAGRFYCGTMAYAETTGAGTMYRLTADGDDRLETTVVWAGVTISNGFGFSPDGSQAYYNDTPTRRTDVFDYDEHDRLVNRRPLMTLTERDKGNPDGLCVDSDGCVWVALWDGSAVRRYTPDGRLDGVVELPVTRVTACTFGGADLDTLYITTSRTGIPAGEQPAAGAFLACRPGVTGQPPLTFAV
ncbi:MAG: SMP-30/gluconolactonase/LRE family protein [Nocardioidaceae bacterium]